MPRYYFNLYRNGAPVPDDEGLEFEDDDIAKREAMESLRDVIPEALTGNLQPVHIGVEIVKEGSGVIDHLTGKLAVHPQAWCREANTRLKGMSQ